MVSSLETSLVHNTQNNMAKKETKIYKNNAVFIGDVCRQATVFFRLKNWVVTQHLLLSLRCTITLGI